MTTNGRNPVEFVYKPPAGRNGRKASQILVNALEAFLEAQGRDGLKEHPALNAAASDALNGRPLSLHRENELRRFLSMEPELEVTVKACPTCGDTAHTVDCGGKPGQPAWKAQRPPKPAHAKPAWVAEATANLVALAEAAKGKPRSFTRNMVR